MADAQLNTPPPLEQSAPGDPTTESLANVLEWFMAYDERVAAIRHPHAEALFAWKQKDTIEAGEEIYPFPRAEDRLAVGIFQALAENNSEESLRDWIGELVTALGEAKGMSGEIAEAYKLAPNANLSPLDAAQLLPTEQERRFYLSARWLETLCTAEVRVLGWVYQQLYGKPYQL